MKLQAAIDRVTLEQAKDLARQLDPIVDIIEMGTSLIKDYGFYALNKEALGLQHAELLLDAKTIDEGQYEFEKGFETGADILTVMGAASQGTLETTYKVAERYGRQMFIDLMEVNDQKLALINLKMQSMACIMPKMIPVPLMPLTQLPASIKNIRRSSASTWLAALT